MGLRTCWGNKLVKSCKISKKENSLKTWHHIKLFHVHLTWFIIGFKLQMLPIEFKHNEWDICSSVIPKFKKFSQGTLALINNLTMPRGAYFQIFKEIIPNSKFAVII